MKQLIPAILISFLFFGFKGKEEKELSPNENKLASCRQNIPLTYRRRDDKIVAKKAKELEGQELILLHFNKKSNKVTFKRYYLISDGEFNYLKTKADYENKRDNIIFLKFTNKYDRFYIAKCFDKVLSENADLKELLKERFDD